MASRFVFGPLYMYRFAFGLLYGLPGSIKLKSLKKSQQSEKALRQRGTRCGRFSPYLCPPPNKNGPKYFLCVVSHFLDYWSQTLHFLLLILRDSGGPKYKIYGCYTTITMIFPYACISRGEVHAFLFISTTFISTTGWDLGHIWELFSKLLLFWRKLLYRKIVLIPNNILNIYLRGRVGLTFRKISSKISTTVPQLKVTGAYKKKACTHIWYSVICVIIFAWIWGKFGTPHR